MKTVFILLLAMLSVAAWSQTSYPPASQAEVNAAATHGKFVAPDTLPGGIAANLPVTVETNVVSPLAYGAVGDGVTDDTVAFQTAINSGKPVYVPLLGHTNGYVVSGLVFSNNETLYGYGAKIIYKPGASGWFVLMGMPSFLTNSIYPTNPIPSGITISGLEFDGGSNAAMPTVMGTRNGIWFSPYGTNNVLRDCVVHGFTGYGVLSQDYIINLNNGQPNFNPYDLSHSCCYNLDIRGCYIGMAVRTGGIPVPYSDADKYLSEYSTYSLIRADYNFIGLWKSGGNQFFSDCLFLRCSNALVDIGGDGGPDIGNPGHGVFSACAFNHSGLNAILATNLVYGDQFVGCTFSGGESGYLTNCTGVTFSDCQIVGGALNLSFDGTNTTARNWMVFPDIADGSSVASVTINNLGAGNHGIMVGRVYGSATNDYDPVYQFLSLAPTLTNAINSSGTVAANTLSATNLLNANAIYVTNVTQLGTLNARGLVTSSNAFLAYSTGAGYQTTDRGNLNNVWTLYVSANVFSIFFGGNLFSVDNNGNASWTGSGTVGSTLFFPTNKAIVALPSGDAGLWSSNGWLYYYTTQHPNGVLISAP